VQYKIDVKWISLEEHTQSAEPCVPTPIPGKAKANTRSKRKDKRQIASLPTQTCPCKPAYPFTPNGVLFF
jgi:hypothetical protein